MDVRTKFIVSMVILGIVIVVLSIFVYLSATTDPFKDDTLSEFPISPIDTEPREAPDAITSPENINTPDEQTLEPEVVATITLADTVQPGDVTTPSESETNEAVYTVRLVTTWSKQLHPDFYPSGAHFSPMVVWSHRLKSPIFESDTVASDGIEVMAETGGTSPLVEEIQDKEQRGYILTHSIGKRIDALEEDEVTITLSKTAPYVTAVSMLAPSPDWFVSAHNIKLFKDGQWIKQHIVPTVMYDAGTDSGTTFTARDIDTNPASPIQRFAGAPIVPIASFEFIRK